MSTQTQVHRLEAGQALPLPRHGAGPAVLTEGEVVVQSPARWLGATVVLPAPVRLVAPAVLPDLPSCHVVAVRASSVVVQEAAPLLSSAGRQMRACAAWVRKMLGKPAGRRTSGPLPG